MIETGTQQGESAMSTTQSVFVDNAYLTAMPMISFIVEFAGHNNVTRDGYMTDDEFANIAAWRSFHYDRTMRRDGWI
jgi:hypothetical protein